MRKFRKGLMVFSISAAMVLTLISCGKKQETTEDDGTFDANSERIQKKTEEINGIVDKYFYFDKDSKKQEEDYYDGLMAGLDDPYSVYYTPEQYAEQQKDDEGKYEGIGAVVSKNYDTGEIYVVNPIVGSPAEEAGLLPDDVFVQIDDLELTVDYTLDAAVGRIRGKGGTTVHLKMYRPNDKEFYEFDIQRREIENVTVEHEMLDGNIGYIKVSQFIVPTAGQFKEAVDDLTDQGMKGLVIDLRGNPGGLVDTAVEMCDYIIADDSSVPGGAGAGMVVYTEDKNGNIIDENKCSDGHSVDVPIVLLVNGNSASSSEIFTGCMKDYGKATIVGTQTYGKGIVQIIHPLSDGSAIKLTIAKYFTPAGNDIHEVGIAPDVEVELDESLKTKVRIDHDEDNQLQEALKQF